MICHTPEMFYKHCLDSDFKTNPFHDLLASATFETVAAGRQGANLVDVNDEDGLVPLVRTTTASSQANQKMLPLHHHLLRLIKTVGVCVEFNNALMEVYDSHYRNMKYHSDQALDLEKNSWIALFSCYKDPAATKSVRCLRAKNKTTLEEVDIQLDHNSVVLFSTDTNAKWWHKIILPTCPPRVEADNLWLGVTFRQSKTWLYFRNELPYFSVNDKPLLLANEEQRKEFYQHRGQENAASVDYAYPDTRYTISAGDIMRLV